jgi:iron complex outermembrane receptor protein
VRGLLDQDFGVQESSAGTKTDTPLIEVPSSVNVINRQQLDSQQLLTLPEALRWVPGVFDQNSRSGFERFTIRGFFAGTRPSWTASGSTRGSGSARSSSAWTASRC